MRNIFKWLQSAASGLSLVTKQLKNDETHSPISLAMVALRKPYLPDASDIIDYLREHWPEDNYNLTAETAEGVIFFSGPSIEMAFVSLMDMPIPWRDLEFPCNSTLNWTDAVREFKKMKAHLIVSSSPVGKDYLQSHILTSKLVQAASSLSNSLGIYWGSANSVWSPKEFETLANFNNSNEPPYALWVGIKIVGMKNKKFTAYTVGMQSFGHLEIEIQNSSKDQLDLFSRTGNVALYLLQSSVTIKDGETIGNSKNERINVTIGASIFHPDRNVYQLDY
jgi:Domain of unknown function (DUF4261)